MDNEKTIFSLELTIAKLLRAGVLIAGLFIFAGWVASVHWSVNPFAEHTVFHGVPLTQELKQAWLGGEWAKLSTFFGLILLVALPFTRVVMTAYLFIHQKEYVLATLAMIVTIALIFSFSLGFEI
jgi:uncharacterized membrane protein